jgi:hypothetical protein
MSFWEFFSANFGKNTDWNNSTGVTLLLFICNKYLLLKDLYTVHYIDWMKLLMDVRKLTAPKFSSFWWAEMPVFSGSPPVLPVL